ncbi:ArsR/SmtB family transcription factor [Schleiferilactobacillus shenzhenensis]|uniref:YceK n=1 Tax=Schleiferilactobacillus shenzhenensis LY-73 TaxID=1231336 RepID=U4TLW7_9LACO|nr:metalloregulator ArsR/SmtB family transcription factor [Schleiferilactobacillus shenzhenensis]ERL65851.1 YceK [Schleiferilactobacillus shenzhenensis LY-73]
MNIEQEDNRLAAIFKVLSEPNRIRILRILYHAGRELTCSEISQQLNISKSTVSYHFKALRLAGLTNTRQEAQAKYLSINRAAFDRYLPHFLETL